MAKRAGWHFGVSERRCAANVAVMAVRHRKTPQCLWCLLGCAGDLVSLLSNGPCKAGSGGLWGILSGLTKSTDHPSMVSILHVINYLEAQELLTTHEFESIPGVAKLSKSTFCCGYKA